MITAISPTDAYAALFSDRPPAFIDVRLNEDRVFDGVAFPGARLSEAQAVSTNRPAVLACQKGLKLSQGAAAMLVAGGSAANWLDGGLVGWRAAGLPVLPTSSVSASGRYVIAGDEPDAAVLHWLVRRLAPAPAVPLLVPSVSVEAVAQRFDAVALSRSEVSRLWPDLAPLLDLPSPSDPPTGRPDDPGLHEFDMAMRERLSR